MLCLIGAFDKKGFVEEADRLIRRFGEEGYELIKASWSRLSRCFASHVS